MKTTKKENPMFKDTKQQERSMQDA